MTLQCQAGLSLPLKEIAGIEPGVSSQDAASVIIVREQRKNI